MSKKISDAIIDQILINNKIPIKRVGSYINAQTAILFQCLKLDCNYEWKTKAFKITTQKTGCSACSGHKVAPNNIGKCRVCKVVLDDENWDVAYKKHKNYICCQCLLNKRLTEAKTQEFKQRQAELRSNLKQKLFAILGNKCQCCSCNDFDLLSLDHIDGGGKKHRELIGIGGGSNFYRHVLNNIDTIEQYRILCYNCNSCRGANGYCPHQEQQDRTIKISQHTHQKGHCRICLLFLTDDNQYKHHHGICKACFIIDCSNRAFATKKEVIANYGGCCSNCQENQPEFLVIDHINNDGAEDRRKTNLVGLRMYRWLLKNNCPKDRYQILCYNCNWKKQLDHITVLK